MNKSISKNKLTILIALLVIVLIAGAGAFAFIDQDTLVLGLSLLSFVIVLTILQFSKWFDWLMLVASILFYGWIQYSTQDPLEIYLIRIGVFVLVTLVAFIISLAINREIGYLLNQYSSNSNLIEELSLHDSLGLIKWQIFQQTLGEEFIRSRRTKKSVSVMMVRLLNYDEYVSAGNKKQAEELMKETARISAGILRTLDKISRYNQDTLGVILPLTSEEEAKIAASRIIDGIAKQANVAVYVGNASFPEDAVSVDKMISRALAALEFAISSEKEQISYAQLNAEED